MDYKSIIESKYNRNNWMQLLSDIFGNRAEFWQAQAMIRDLDHTVAQWAVQLGKITLQDGNIIAVYEVELAGSVQLERNRAAIRNLLCTHWRGQGCAGAFMFCQRKEESVLRFSYVSEAWTFKEDGSYVKEATEPRRYTYYLGEGHRSRTAIDQFSKLKNSDFTLKALTKAFSVEAISDMFFDGYKKQYEDIILYITGKKMVKVGGKWEEKQMGEPCAEIMSEFARFENPEKSVRDYVKRLMGRLVFIQFLQKKGWMGVPAGDSWLGGDKEFLQHLFINTPYKDTFVDDVLEPLFNDLNTRRGEDLVSSEKVGTNIKVPYLNGGLFERSAEDDTTFPLPARYMQSLIVDFFAAYNFTIDENDPNDAEVGVDAEMLGRIFENLLEDNKDKGAFYTPKEIVQYMCRESLIAYLQTETGIEEVRLRKFVTEHSTKDCLTSAECGQVLLKIHNVKICDPAIGSGAFPMGLLNELVACRIALGEHQRKKANIKRDIIQNNIYGVDIERGAVDIARLRFWLSLIVDEDNPEALPNMDFKIVQGNSLISTFNGKYLNLEENKSQVFQQVIKKEKEHLHQLQKDYFAAIGERKMLLGIDIKTALLNIVSAQFGFELRKAAHEQAVQEDELFGLKTKDIANKIQLPQDVQDAIAFGASLRQRLNDETIPVEERAKIELNFFDWKIMFADVFDSKGGFDIVIGNPPYGVSIKGDYRKVIEKGIGKVPDYEIYYYFIEIAKKLLKEKGILSYIIPNTWLFNTYASRYRTELFLIWHLLEILDCSKFKIFESATVMNSVLLFNKTSSGSSSIGFRSTEGASSFSELIRSPKFYMSKEQILSMNQNWGLAFRLSSDKMNVIQKMSNSKNCIADYFECSQGFIPYRLSDLVKQYGEQKGKRIKEERLWHSKVKTETHWIQELYGRDITKYDYNSTGEFVNYGKHVATYVDLKFFNQKRIVVREITNPCIIGCIVEEQFVNDPQLLPLIKKQSNLFIDYESLWGIINSKIATFYHFNHSPKATKGAFPKILVSDLNSFPIRYSNHKIYEDISVIAQKILHKVSADNTYNPRKDERQIDNLVYVLYDLTYDEVKVVEPDFPMTEAEYNEFKQQHQDK